MSQREKLLIFIILSEYLKLNNIDNVKILLNELDPIYHTHKSGIHSIILSTRTLHQVIHSKLI